MFKQINIDLIPAPIPFEGTQKKHGLFQDTTHIIGFEFDGTACFRKGTKAGPNALHHVSDGIESYSPYLDADLEDISFVDLGNLPIDLSIHAHSWVKV
tara:strand:- start:1801 stop:2094 length:294 start_codon:yes stop_codon:yes gene_type:complete